MLSSVRRRRVFAIVLAFLVVALACCPVHAAKTSKSKTKQISVAEFKKYKKGIDVSGFQNDINWEKVRKAGVDFAFIRAGYRGSSTGKLMEDTTFKKNIKGATKAGVKVGVYFFTQATTEKEAREEANYTIKLIKASGCKVNLPIVIDTEAGVGKARADKLSKEQRTKVIKAFCDEVKKKGYTPMIYASTSWLNNKLDMSKLKGYYVWCAQYNKTCTYKGQYQCWQYTSSGKVDGIKGRVDMNKFK